MTGIHDYITTLDVPAAPPPRRGFAAEAATTFGSDQQAMVVGAQMAEFSATVPASLRPVISEGMLLGQLAADKAAGQTGDVRLWFDTFGGVMKKIGWLQTGLDFQEQTTADINADVHEAIIPVITAMLGPQAAAASIIMAVLKGMQDMKTDSPWLTVFQRKSQSFHGAKFQLSYVDAGPDGGAGLKTAFFGIDAHQAITQVLFFKFSTQGATVQSARSDMALSAAQIQDLATPLHDKVAPFIVDNIKSIDIG